MSGTLKSFVAATARPLPVVLLADVSGSMEGAKIQALNGALGEMIAAFGEESTSRAEIQVAIITFGGASASVHMEPTAARGLALRPLAAYGATPMGSAFAVARGLLEDRVRIPSRAYTPAVVLLSDGIPTDAWEQGLAALLGSERGKKAQRFALAIGEDADEEVLRCFLGEAEARVFRAHEAAQIRDFFRLVTLSVAARSRSANPNQAIALPPSDLDALL